jgi:poly(3-hydroxyoctanoate) depolymerase
MPVDRGRLPGRVVTAGGRAVHVVEQDGASPTVLLLGGCGVPFYAWDAVLELLGDRRIVRMDRPGLAGTPWPGRLPTLGEEIATLVDLIDSLGSAPVVVAHSMAGFHAEGLARRHPERVAALVLVDGSVEREPAPPGHGEGWRRLATTADRVMRLVPPTRSLASFADRLLCSVQSTQLRLTTPRPAAQRAVYREPGAIASVVAEQGAYAAQVTDLAALRDETAWPGLPVRVLTAADEGGQAWVQAQVWLAEELRAEHTLVPDSRHLMMIDRPDAIAAAISSLP